MIFQILSALVLIGIGIVGCFFGYKVFKFYLGFLGFVIGFSLSYQMLNLVIDNAFVVSIVIGIVTAIISYLVYKLGVFILFTYIGSAIGQWFVVDVLGLDAGLLATVLILVAGIVTGFIASALQIEKMAIAIATSIFGSYFIVAGIAVLYINNFKMEILISATGVPQIGNFIELVIVKSASLVVNNPLLALVFGVFLTLGILVQLKKLVRHKK